MTQAQVPPAKEQSPRIADTMPDAGAQRAERETTPLVVTARGASDAGRTRALNEDQFVLATFTGSLWVEQSSFPQPRVQCGGPQAHLFIVADGVGGNPGGEQASSVAVQAIQRFLVAAFGWLRQLSGPVGILEELKSALSRADRAVVEATMGRPELQSMATTLTLACSLDDLLYVAHAGDSRCYLLREGRLTQITRDHTMVSALVDAGVVSGATAATHDLRHVVTNVVGGGTQGVTAEVHKLSLLPGDVVLLCTDGLSEMLSNDRIADILRAEPSPDRASLELIAAANDAGGRDNITAVVARFDATTLRS